MSATVNAGARLDRLPISRFHWRILSLIGGGMFLDAFEIYLAGSVLGSLVKSGWSDMAHNGQFITSTFLGMMIGAWTAGMIGDHFGRRFSYQLNLLIFGLASLAGAAAPSMTFLIAARFFMGLGLGAEIVIGYASLSEFVPPRVRGRWITGLAVLTNFALFASSMLGLLIIPSFGWRPMFAIAGVGALIVWYLRKAMPESPRWLERKGRMEEAERVMAAIEAEVSASGASLREPAPPTPNATKPLPPFMAIFDGKMLGRTIAASAIAIATNAALYGFVVWMPTFFVQQGMSMVRSLGYTTLMAFGGPVGATFALFGTDRFGRKPTVVAASLLAVVFGLIYPYVGGTPLFVPVGFLLVASLFTIVGAGFALYIPELYPTDLRLRGVGFVNTLGRAAGMGVPYLVVPVFAAAGIAGITTSMAVILAVQALAVVLLGIETRHKPLEALHPEVI